jgi:hypothetical protein
MGGGTSSLVGELVEGGVDIYEGRGAGEVVCVFGTLLCCLPWKT